MRKARFRGLKYGKIAIVVFLTVLIWVWADLELDETPPDYSAVIEIDESYSEGVWVSFGQSSSRDIKVTLRGPHSAFVTLNRQLRNEGRRLTFSFDAERERMSEPGGHSLNVLDFLQKDKSLRSVGIKVVECVPEFIDVDVVALVKRESLPVECFDDKGQSIRVESIDPSTVSMFAPESVRTARVQLSEGDIVRARSVGIEKTPYVVAEGFTKEAVSPVKVMLPSEEKELAVYNIAASLDVAMSLILVERYKPVVTNLTDMITTPISIRATEQTKERYENQDLPKMTLHIFDADAEKADEEQSREVVYNFPEESVRKGEIELIKRPGQQPAIARFKLIRLKATETADGRAD